jgi:hypothetical protein
MVQHSQAGSLFGLIGLYSQDADEWMLCEEENIFYRLENLPLKFRHIKNSPTRL